MVQTLLILRNLPSCPKNVHYFRKQAYKVCNNLGLILTILQSKNYFYSNWFFRFILITVEIYSCKNSCRYGVNTPLLKFFLFCVQFRIPLQQLQSSGSTADLYSLNRAFTGLQSPLERFLLKNLGYFTGFYRASLIVPPSCPGSGRRIFESLGRQG